MSREEIAESLAGVFEGRELDDYVNAIADQTDEGE